MKLRIDVHSRKPYPSCALSNFADHPFMLDGVSVRCMEGLLQSLKAPPSQQQAFCQMDGPSAKEAGSLIDWRSNGGVFHWQGQRFSRYSKAYQQFLRRAYEAMTRQCPEFRQALLDTGHRLLLHSIGKYRKKNTCLTVTEFTFLLYHCRRMARK